ncbi:MAG: hypothetical protein JXQ73_09700 [Phycisphaerae bacterium]|nr:hypothetical protein [Phycisphaerae bacterium]
MSILMALAASGIVLGQAGSQDLAKETTEADLAKAFDAANAYLAVGIFDEGRRVPIDNSPVRCETPYGPIEIRGMASYAVKQAKDWIGRMLQKEVCPPPETDFRAYRRVGDFETDFRAYLRAGGPGCDAVTVDYRIGQDQIRVSQTIWLVAITVEGPETACNLADPDIRVIGERVRDLARRILRSEEEMSFSKPERCGACLVARKASPTSATIPEYMLKWKDRRPTSQEVRAHFERIAGDPNRPPSWWLEGWWTDGRRLGFLCMKHPGGDPNTIVGPGLLSNRAWFRRPRSKDAMRRMAAEYRAATERAKEK